VHADECKSGEIFTAVMHFDQLTLKETNIRLETVERSYLNEKEMIVVLLELMAGGN